MLSRLSVAAVLVSCAGGCALVPISEPESASVTAAAYQPREVRSQPAATQPVVVTAAPAPTTAPAPVPAPAPASKPIVIDAAARDRIARAALENVTRRFGVDRDPRLNEYLVLVGSLVAMNAPGAEGEYAYTLLDTDQPVSCAVWPKTVCVSRGLLKQMQDESELAGVIAREVSNLIAGRALKAAGLPAPSDAASQPATRPAAAATPLPNAAVNRYAAKLTDVLTKDGMGRELDEAADVDGAKFVAAARYAPDGFLRLLTRQKPAAGQTTASSGAWDRIKALDANVQIIAKAYPAADVRLPARFESYVRPH